VQTLFAVIFSSLTTVSLLWLKPNRFCNGLYSVSFSFVYMLTTTLYWTQSFTKLRTIFWVYDLWLYDASTVWMLCCNASTTVLTQYLFTWVHVLNMYTVSQKKGATITMTITLSILDGFAKFFHYCKQQ